MQRIPDVRETEKKFRNVVLTMGSFDGVHVGHRIILNNVLEHAKRLNGTPAVLTMEPHPREYFSPEHAPNLLTSAEKKAEILEELGIEVLYTLPFDSRTASMEAQDFIRDILAGRCEVVALIVGHDCRFGKEARGDFELLRGASGQYGFSVQQVAPVLVDGERVSSTLIRERVLLGDLEGIEDLLGRKYSLSGVVETGMGRGAEIGFPTANIRPYHSAVPAQGVYMAEARADGFARPAAVNIGIAPTIRQEDLVIEAHVLDYRGDLVDQEIELVFHRRIRSEKKFPSVEALVAQITKDVQATRDYFSENPIV